MRPRLFLRKQFCCDFDNDMLLQVFAVYFLLQYYYTVLMMVDKLLQTRFP